MNAVTFDQLKNVELISLHRRAAALAAKLDDLLEDGKLDVSQWGVLAENLEQQAARTGIALEARGLRDLVREL